VNVARERVVETLLEPLEGVEDRPADGLEGGLFDRAQLSALSGRGQVAPSGWKFRDDGPIA
jgi:hypothetical protein